MVYYDVVIIGAGPAGLTAGLYLSQAKYSTLVLDKEGFGGYIKNVELIENYPGFSEGVSGAFLASEMIKQAGNYGLQVKIAEVSGIELFSSTSFVQCEDGEGYTASVIIIAGGASHKKLGVPGENEFAGKGVFHCGLCDGGAFNDKVVAVCGGGNAGLTEALYMAKIASKVIIFESMPALSATALLQERAAANPKIEIRCGVEIEALTGRDRLESLEYKDSNSGAAATLPVDGVLVNIGLEPNTGYLRDIVSLDSQGQIIVNQNMETDVPSILAAGDIRSGSVRQISAAVGDGTIAAVTAQHYLQ